MGPPRAAAAPRAGVVLSALALLLLLGPLSVASAGADDVAGPIVKLDATAADKAVEATKGDDAQKPQGESGDQTIAQRIDAALKEEFEEETAAEAAGGTNFNATVHAGAEEAKLETVVRISGRTHEAEYSSSNTTADGSAAAAGREDANSTTGGSDLLSAKDALAAATVGEVDAGVDRIIDSQDNEFVLSKPKESVASLTLDMQLIRDVTVVLVSASLFGSAFEAVRQPVINGYLIGGAVVGPGGLNWVKELVQVESLAQLGVQLLLFGLGLELSLSKLRAVGGVAVLGGTLQIVLLAVLGGMVAAAAGAPAGQGVFVGALLSMSSTAVVVKCLEVMRTSSSAYGQITVGTLILQDCMVGLMFALLPIFKGMPAVQPSGLAADTDAAEAKGRVVLMVLAVLFKLSLAMAAALAVAKTLLPPVFRLVQRHGSRELVQLGLVSFCCLVSAVSHDLGLSSELGAFVAGVMVSVALGHGSHPNHHTHMYQNGDELAQLAHDVATHGSAAGPLATMATMGHPPGESARSSAINIGSMAVTPVPSAHKLAGLGDGGDLSPTRQGAGPDAQDVEADWSGLANLREREQREREERERERERVRAAQQAPHGALAAYYSIESARNVLVALFMASIGLIMSPRFLLDHLGVLTVGVAVVVLVKGALVAGVVRFFSVGMRTSLAVGLSMAHVGEFSFVLLSHAVQGEILPLQVYMLLLGVTALSLLSTPFVVLLAMHWVLPKEAVGGAGGNRSAGGANPGASAASEDKQGRPSKAATDVGVASTRADAVRSRERGRGERDEYSAAGDTLGA